MNTHTHIIHSISLENPDTVFNKYVLTIAWDFTISQVPSSSCTYRFGRQVAAGSRAVGTGYRGTGATLELTQADVSLQLLSLCLPPSSLALNWGVRIRGRQEAKQ